MTEQEGLVAARGRSAAELASIVDPGKAPTAEQCAIIEAGVGPSLVVAGAGSGKTETLSMRILYLLDNAPSLFGRAISPDEILCLTFTRKAAAEIAERASQRIGAVYGADAARPEPSVSTYNGYAAALVAEHGLRVAVDPASTVLTDAGLWQRADAVVSTWRDSIATDAAVSSVTPAVPRLSAQARDHSVTPPELKSWALDALAFLESLPKKAGDAAPGVMTQELARYVDKVRSLASLADLVAAFDDARRRDSLLDFSDQVDIAVRLCAMEEVQRIERARYVAVLLDEFQDTSPPQLDLFATMFGPQHAVMAVGDPHQAIYGFRGASASALTQFVSRFGGEAVARHHLSVSWRNEAAVLAAANVTVAALPQRVAALPLRSRGEELGIPEPTRRAPAVIASRHTTAREQADAVVGFLAARRGELGHGGGTVVTAAVLCRRRAQFEEITDALTRAGMAFEVVGLGGLLDEPHVADVLALLTVAHDPSRGDALMRLLTGERIALGPRDLGALHDWSKELSRQAGASAEPFTIVDALTSLPGPAWHAADGRPLTQAARLRLQALSDTIDAIRRHTYLPLTELVQFAERAWQLDIEAAITEPQQGRPRAIDALVDAVRGFTMSAEKATLGALLAWIDAAKAQEDGLDAPVREPDPAAVQVLTIHAAKGLEWDVVAVPGLNDGQFPKVGVPSNSSPDYTDGGWLSGIGALPFDLRRDRDNLPSWNFRHAKDHKELAATIAEFRADAGAARLEEERRLFYVALTRARSHVLLAGCWLDGGVSVRQPSPYVTELLDAGVAQRASWAEPPADVIASQAEPVEAQWPPAATPRQASRRALANEVFAALDSQHAEAMSPADSPWPPAGVSAGEPLVDAITAMLAESTARKLLADQVEFPSHLSTSALVALRRDGEAFALQVRRPIPVEPTVAARTGSALHAWIESHYGHIALWEDQELGAVDQHLEELKRAFLASPWASRTPSHVEADVELPLAGLTIRSRIDAVFPAGNGLERVTVVDWKSGSPPRDEEEKAAREIQLAMYRIAWARSNGLRVEDVDAAFHYVGPNVTVFPERLLAEAELEALIRGA